MESKFNYISCNKGGFHQNELINMICLDKNCQNNALVCPICYETEFPIILNRLFII